MKYKLYTTSEKAWDAMIDEIDRAKKSIFIEMYIFLDDTQESHDFFGKLIEKSKNGINIIIVADAYGSSNLKGKKTIELKNAGIEIIFFSHWLRHIHRKILVIDNKIAFIGGVNIGKKFKSWNDLQLKITGKIVKTFLRSFAYTYEISGGKKEEILKLRNNKISTKLKFWLMEHWPSKNVYVMKNHYIEKIKSAEKKITIITPYFTPPRWMKSILDDAIRRNVEIEIIIPKKVDIFLMNKVNFCYIYDLYSIGIKFYLHSEMNHSKLLLIDNEDATLGSQNIDLASFRYNNEVGISFKEKSIIKELNTIITLWKKNSTMFKPKKYKMNILDYLIFALMKILRPIL